MFLLVNGSKGPVGDKEVHFNSSYIFPPTQFKLNGYITSCTLKNQDGKDQFRCLGCDELWHVSPRIYIFAFLYIDVCCFQFLNRKGLMTVCFCSRIGTVVWYQCLTHLCCGEHALLGDRENELWKKVRFSDESFDGFSRGLLPPPLFPLLCLGMCACGTI